MADVTLPQLGETVTEGTITRWFKKVGDTVAADEALFEVSTDKVDTEVPSPVAGTLTEPWVCDTLLALAKRLGHTGVLARDLPGFIVNHAGRGFAPEGLRILSEGVADVQTVDRILRDVAGFRMGPFELMDLIGHDVNYAVTQSVFDAYYHDPRFTPSIIQKELLNEIGRAHV